MKSCHVSMLMTDDPKNLFVIFLVGGNCGFLKDYFVKVKVIERTSDLKFTVNCMDRISPGSSSSRFL